MSFDQNSNPTDCTTCSLDFNRVQYHSVNKTVQLVQLTTSCQKIVLMKNSYIVIGTSTSKKVNVAEVTQLNCKDVA